MDRIKGYTHWYIMYKVSWVKKKKKLFKFSGFDIKRSLFDFDSRERDKRKKIKDFLNKGSARVSNNDDYGLKPVGYIRKFGFLVDNF